MVKDEMKREGLGLGERDKDGGKGKWYEQEKGEGLRMGKRGRVKDGAKG